jgi:hypothetical protein
MNKCRKMEAYRQGEIVFVKRTKDVEVDDSRFIAKGDKVIREGEQTGHLHEIVGDATLFTARWGRETDMKMTAVDDVVIQHPEHKDLKLPAGEYDIVIQREYDEERERYVQD